MLKLTSRYQATKDIKNHIRAANCEVVTALTADGLERRRVPRRQAELRAGLERRQHNSVLVDRQVVRQCLGRRRRRQLLVQPVGHHKVHVQQQNDLQQEKVGFTMMNIKCQGFVPPTAARAARRSPQSPCPAAE